MRRAAVAFALAGVIAGCGGSESPSAQVLTTTTAYLKALGTGRAAAACGYLTSSLRAQFEHSGTPGAPCGGKPARLTPARAGVSGFQLSGATATVSVVGRRGETATIVLTKSGGGWRISDLRRG